MKIAFVFSQVLGDSRDLLLALARNAKDSLTLLKGDEPLPNALRSLRFADRVWFEGVGPLFDALAQGPAGRWVAESVLRLSDAQAAAFDVASCGSLVSDIIVGSRPAYARLMEQARPDRRLRVHLVAADRKAMLLGKQSPLDLLGQMYNILHTWPDDLHRNAWPWFASASQCCKGRTLVVGEPPVEILRYLADAQGCRLIHPEPEASPEPIDTLVVWGGLSCEQGPDVLRHHLQRLCRGGSAMIVPSADLGTTDSLTLSTRAVADVLRQQQRLVPAEITLTGPAVTLQSTASDQPAIHVELVGEPPRVSAVVPVYNDPDRVGRALWSLRRQTWPNLEILVVDDGSTDHTAQAVAQHLNDRRVRYLYKEHTGRPGTRNAGVENAQGEFIAWLDSDDEAMPNRIALQMEQVRKNPQVDIVTGDGLFFNPDGSFKQRRRYKPFDLPELPALVMQGFSTICPVLNTCATIRRSLYQRVGLYGADFFRCQDYDFYLRTAMAGGVTYAHVQTPLVRVYTAPITAKHFENALAVYWILICKMLDFFPVEQLRDQKARDLHESGELCVARMLLGLALLYKAPCEHPIWATAQGLIEKVRALPSAVERAGALNLQGNVAMFGNDLPRAQQLFEQALTLAPDLAEAKDNLKALKEKETNRDSHIEQQLL